MVTSVVAAGVLDSHLEMDSSVDPEDIPVAVVDGNAIEEDSISSNLSCKVLLPLFASVAFSVSSYDIAP